MLLLTACGPVGDGDDSGTSGSGGAVRDGGTMTVALADDPDMLDPTLARTLVGRMGFMSATSSCPSVRVGYQVGLAQVDGARMVEQCAGAGR